MVDRAIEGCAEFEVGDGMGKVVDLLFKRVTKREVSKGRGEVVHLLVECFPEFEMSERGRKGGDWLVEDVSSEKKLQRRGQGVEGEIKSNSAGRVEEIINFVGSVTNAEMSKRVR